MAPLCLLHSGAFCFLTMAGSNNKNHITFEALLPLCLIVLFALFLCAPASFCIKLLCPLEEDTGYALPESRSRLEGLSVDKSGGLPRPEFIFSLRGRITDSLPDKRDIAESVACFYENLDIEDDKLWVNLSYRNPGEVIPGRLEQTLTGRILLEADLQLKRDIMDYLNDNPVFRSSAPREVQVWIRPGEISYYADEDNLRIFSPVLQVCMRDCDRKAMGEAAEEMLQRIQCRVNVAPEYRRLRELYKSLLMSHWFRRKYPFFPAKGIPVSFLSEAVYPKHLSWEKKTYWHKYAGLSREINSRNRVRPGGDEGNLIVWGGISFADIGLVLETGSSFIPDGLADLRQDCIVAKVNAGEVEIEPSLPDLPGAKTEIPLAEISGKVAKAEEGKKKRKEKGQGKIRAPPQIIASAGCRSEEIPPNTLRAFSSALESGADGIEVDLRITSDGEIVAFHDELLDYSTTGRGRVEDYSFAGLRKLGFRCAGYVEFSDRIPLFEEILELASHFSRKRSKSPAIYLDVKTLYEEDSGKMLRIPANLLLIEKIIRLTKSYPQINFVFNSFFPGALAEMRKIDRGISLCYDLAYYTPELLKTHRDEILDFIDRNKIGYVHLSGSLLGEDFAGELLKRKISVTANFDSIDADTYFSLMGRGIKAVGIKYNIEEAVKMRKSGSAMARNIKTFPWFLLFMGLIFHSSYQQIFLQQAGYSLETIGWAFSLFSLVFSVASWPLGWLADKVGKKTLLFLCGILNSVGIFLLAFSGIHPSALLLSQFFSAFAQSGLAVTANALLYESTNRIGQSNRYAFFLGKAYSFFWAAMAVSTITGSVLATVFSLQAVILLSAVSSLGAVFSLFSFSSVPSSGPSSKTNPIRQAGRDLVSAFKNSQLRRLLILDLAVGQGISVLIGFFLQPMLSLAGVSLVYFGVISFAYSLLQSLSAKLAERFQGVVFSRILRSLVFVFLAVIITVSFAAGNCVPLIVMFFAALFFWDGLSGIVIDARIQEGLNDNFRSQWFGIKSVLGGLTLILIQSFVNVSLAHSGIQVAALLVMSLIIFISLLIKTRQA